MYYTCPLFFPTVQWGITNAGDLWTPTVTFPVSFSAACYAAVCTTIRDYSSSDGSNYVYNVTKTGMNLRIDSGSNEQKFRGYWIAIGK